MRGGDPLLTKLTELKRSDDDPRRRGVLFERLVAAVFRRGHFEVDRTAMPAKPRQTDVFASSGSTRYLVEAKWRQTQAFVGDVAEVQDRLRRIQAGVVGVLISATGFAKTTVAEAEGHRDLPVLLLDLADLENVLEGRQDLARLLEERHNALLVHARALPLRTEPRRTDTNSLVESDAVILRGDKRIPWVTAEGGFGQFVFTRELPDIDWTTAPGVGVTVDMSPEIRDETKLLDAIRRLAEHGWVTSSGHWNLQQATRNWHGMGTTSLAQAVAARRQRYDGLDEIHHTEVLCYTDECEGGFFTISADLAAADNGIVWRVDVSLQLTGIPLDEQPLRTLGHALGVTRPVFFRPRRERSVQTVLLRDHRAVDLSVSALLVQLMPSSEDDQEWVCGIVVKNPFRSGRRLAPEGLPEQFRDTDLMMCSLSNWHPLAWHRQRYYLRRIESAWTSDALVVNAVADWRDTRRSERVALPVGTRALRSHRRLDPER